MPRQSKRYCFTIPCREPHVESRLKSFFHEYCLYLIYHHEREIGPQYPMWDGQAHPTCLHGFFTMKKKQSVTGLHKALKPINFTHLNAAQGTSEEISEHHKKGDYKYKEFGVCPYQGKHTDKLEPSNAHDKKVLEHAKKNRSKFRYKSPSILRAKNLSDGDKQILEWLKSKELMKAIKTKKT
jgi:hypothetical protein